MAQNREAFYFGCWDRLGHFLFDQHGTTKYWAEKVEGFPKEWPGLLDAGFLQNGKHADIPDGRVFWTCAFDLREPKSVRAAWYAFFWWDRSVDKRGACNSGFYVSGFLLHQPEEAFAFACGVFPEIVARQKFPLVLQMPPPQG